MLKSIRNAAIYGLLAAYYTFCPAYGDSAKKIVNPKKITTRSVTNFQKNEKDKALETSVVFYTKKDSPVLALVNVTHLADKGYYKDIQTVLDSLDTVLYEGVGSIEENPLEVLDIPQHLFWLNYKNMFTFIKEELDLSYQGKQINYRKKWILVDYTGEEFFKERFEKTLGLSFLGDIGLGALVHGCAFPLIKSGKGIDSLFSSEKQAIINLRNGFISRPTKAYDSEEDPLNCLVKERNRRVISKLDELLGNLPNNIKSLGILYGAGHAPHFDLEIRKRGYKSVETIWLEAWKVRDFDFRDEPSWRDYDIKHVIKVIQSKEKKPHISSKKKPGLVTKVLESVISRSLSIESDEKAKLETILEKKPKQIDTDPSFKLYLAGCAATLLIFYLIHKKIMRE